MKPLRQPIVLPPATSKQVGDALAKLIATARNNEAFIGTDDEAGFDFEDMPNAEARHAKNKTMNTTKDLPERCLHPACSAWCDNCGKQRPSKIGKPHELAKVSQPFYICRWCRSTQTRKAKVKANFLRSLNKPNQKISDRAT